MSKYVASIIICLLGIAAITEARWYGTVKKDGNGVSVTVKALGGNTPEPQTVSNSSGEYTLDWQRGMIDNQWYDCVWADTTISGTYYGGHCDGGYYHAGTDVQKDITITHPPNYCDFSK